MACPAASVNGDNQGGAAGLWINQDGSTGDGDIYAAMTAANNVSIPAAPAGAPSQYNAILAPSLHAPNGDCLAVINGYSNNAATGGHTSEVMAVYDYCDNGGRYEGALPIDATFLNSYVRIFSNGNQTPEYVIETIKGGDSAWHMIIYNVVTKTWDQYYQSAPGQSANLPSVGQMGWVELKTSLLNGVTCPTSTTQFGTSGIRVHYINGSWSYLNDANSPQLYKAGSCLSSPSPYFAISYNTTDWGWYVSQL